ncbi:MAG: pro-sigmaK processing inhibitor BofA family protein [Oscillospiraceae bacterium]|jgi:hypothetical protein|nr:pro-sigmaK processing inhibitor BofA family protein [Oscillospiraceae bacterium]
MNDFIFYGIWAVIGLIMLLYYAKRKKTFISSVLGMGSGMAALLVLHYFGESINFAPELSMFNTLTALILGVPGVIMMIIVNRLL